MGFFNGGYSVGTTFYSLSANKGLVKQGEEFTITFTTNASAQGPFAYTITGVDSSDINGASLTGGLVDNQTITFVNTSPDIKNFKISLDNGYDQSYVILGEAVIHVFGTYLSKGGPSSGGSLICNGGCDVYFYFRTITPIPNFQGLDYITFEVITNQWYLRHLDTVHQIDFIYGPNYEIDDLANTRGFPIGPFSPHGIGITYVDSEDPCVYNEFFESTAYGDNPAITKIRGTFI